MKIHFILLGNQEDPTGNPIPYFRQTQRSKFSDGAKRYRAWQNFVLGHFWTAAYKFKDAQKFMDTKTGRLALPKKTEVTVSVKVWWKNGVHGDLDNIIKGILDAIFENDKGVRKIEAESFEDRDKKGRVEIEIIV